MGNVYSASDTLRPPMAMQKETQNSTPEFNQGGIGQIAEGVLRALRVERRNRDAARRKVLKILTDVRDRSISEAGAVNKLVNLPHARIRNLGESAATSIANRVTMCVSRAAQLDKGQQFARGDTVRGAGIDNVSANVYTLAAIMIDRGNYEDNPISPREWYEITGFSRQAFAKLVNSLISIGLVDRQKRGYYFLTINLTKEDLDTINNKIGKIFPNSLRRHEIHRSRAMAIKKFVIVPFLLEIVCNDAPTSMANTSNRKAATQLLFRIVTDLKDRYYLKYNTVEADRNFLVRLRQKLLLQLRNVNVSPGVKLTLASLARIADPERQTRSLASNQGFVGIDDVAEKLERVLDNVKQPTVITVNKSNGRVFWALREDIERPHKELIWKKIGQVKRLEQGSGDKFFLRTKGSLGQLVIMPGVDRKQIETELIVYLSQRKGLSLTRVIEPQESSGIASRFRRVSSSATGL